MLASPSVAGTQGPIMAAAPTHKTEVSGCWLRSCFSPRAETVPEGRHPLGLSSRSCALACGAALLLNLSLVLKAVGSLTHDQ